VVAWARIAAASTAVTVSRTWQQSEQPVSHCMSVPWRTETRAKNASTLSANSSNLVTDEG
jgi:hypothetical protein